MNAIRKVETESKAKAILFLADIYNIVGCYKKNNRWIDVHFQYQTEQQWEEFQREVKAHNKWAQFMADAQNTLTDIQKLQIKMVREKKDWELADRLISRDYEEDFEKIVKAEILSRNKN